MNCPWLLPFVPSPNRDNGYDVSDHYGVEDRHGTLGDGVDFLHAADERGINVLIDLVVNRTSNEHPWFERARADDERYCDYYVWTKDPPEPIRPGHPSSRARTGSACSPTESTTTGRPSARRTTWPTNP